jgi:hypothetical protein
MTQTTNHNLAAGDKLTFITCSICYCSVIDRFWDKHFEYHTGGTK